MHMINYVHSHNYCVCMCVCVCVCVCVRVRACQSVCMFIYIFVIYVFFRMVLPPILSRECIVCLLFTYQYGLQTKSWRVSMEMSHQYILSSVN